MHPTRIAGLRQTKKWALRNSWGKALLIDRFALEGRTRNDQSAFDFPKAAESHFSATCSRHSMVAKAKCFQKNILIRPKSLWNIFAVGRFYDEDAIANSMWPGLAHRRLSHPGHERPSCRRGRARMEGRSRRGQGD